MNNELRAYQIQVATPHHAPGIVDMHRRSLFATYPSMAAGIARETVERRYDEIGSRADRIQVLQEGIAAQDENYAIFVAASLLTGEVIGYSSVNITELDLSPGWRMLSGCYVATDRHGEGIGTNLVQRTIDKHKDRPLSLWVGRHLTARYFYEKLGFVSTGITTKDYDRYGNLSRYDVSMLRPPTPLPMRNTGCFDEAFWSRTADPIRRMWRHRGRELTKLPEYMLEADRWMPHHSRGSKDLQVE